MRRIACTIAGAAALVACAAPAGAAVYEYRMDLTAERSDIWISHSKGQRYNCSPDGDGRWVYAGKGSGSLSVAVRGVRVVYKTGNWLSSTEEFRVNRGRVRQAARYDLTVEGTLAGCPTMITAHRPPDTSGCGARAITAAQPLRGWISERSHMKGTTVLALAPKGALFGGRCPSEAPQQFHFEAPSPARAQIAAGRKRVVFKGSRVDMLTQRNLAMVGQFERTGSGRVTWTWNAVLTRVR